MQQIYSFLSSDHSRVKPGMTENEVGMTGQMDGRKNEGAKDFFLKTLTNNCSYEKNALPLPAEI